MAITYGHYCQQFLTIDMDNDGLYVIVPGMSEDFFKVRVDESGVCPVATHCRCSKFAHKGICDHCEITNSFYARIYRSSIAKAEQAALEKAIDEADDREEAEEMMVIAEQIITTKKDQTPLIVEDAQLVPSSENSQGMASTVKSADLFRKDATDLFVADTSDTFYSSPAPVATPSITFAELIEQEDQMSLIVPRKIDGHSVRTANFFSALPSRKPAA